MAIIYLQDKEQFHLTGGGASYVFRVMENRQLEHLYHGKQLPADADLSYLAERGHRDMQAGPFFRNPDFSLEHIRQEYPPANTGDCRHPAYELERGDGSRVFDFRYRTHRIYDGKREIPGLPAVYTEDPAEAETLEVDLEDEETGTILTLYYTVFRDFPAIARHARFTGGKETVVIRRAMSLSLDYPDRDWQMLTLCGAWARERAVRTQPLHYGVQSVYSLRGCSSHQFNPFLGLVRDNTTEESGEAIGLSLLYSGDFVAAADVDNFDVTRLLIGINPDEFSWTLRPGEIFDTPEAVLVYSDHGLGGMSRTFHTLYRERLARGYWRDHVRPILINNWEATYFDFDESCLLSMAKKARELGVELFVLDDGWFGKRNSAMSSLGDWIPNLEKLPDGISGLSRKIVRMGLAFGLWIEPEMVSVDSDLYRRHPDWVLGDSRHPLSFARNQLVLDFSKEEVVDFLYSALTRLFDSAEISYIKWDMNRSLTEVFSAGNPAWRQPETKHRYILGVYRLYERLRRAYPKILFESCASGGARFDPGMLYYAPQAWTSDDTDAVERVSIQYGTSIVYPVSGMGSHVSKVPNEQLGRMEPLRTRGITAMFGTFGYELDITKLSPEELGEMAQQTALMKKYRKLIQFGNLYRLRSPFAGRRNEAAWMILSEQGDHGLAAYFRFLQEPEAPYRRLRLQGLDPDETYLVRELYLESPREVVRSGAELMQTGIILSDSYSGVRDKSLLPLRGDYLARLFEIIRI
ncbi:alpha-galactosidase [Clostridium vitabionis]|uniref:alpha-galactosidase n=1 Tax=Clostridium vitabionis TaxID=2784388 RepID=UPI00188C5C00|nr:alpha-galactosidase [Clostridium vitabionis]